MATVLVTGGSGYIASYCILALLAQGHEVRTTVRSIAREAEIRAMLARGGANPGPASASTPPTCNPMPAGPKLSAAATTSSTSPPPPSPPSPSTKTK